MLCEKTISKVSDSIYCSNLGSLARLEVYPTPLMSPSEVDCIRANSDKSVIQPPPAVPQHQDQVLQKEEHLNKNAITFPGWPWA